MAVAAPDGSTRAMTASTLSMSSAVVYGSPRQESRLRVGHTLRAAGKLSHRIGRLDANVRNFVGERTSQRWNEVRTFEPANSADRLQPDRQVAVGQTLAKRRQVAVGLSAAIFSEEHALPQRRRRLRMAGRLENREQSERDQEPDA